MQRPESSRHVQGRNEQAVAHGFKLRAQLRQGEGLAGQRTHKLPAALPLTFCVLGSFSVRLFRTHSCRRTSYRSHTGRGRTQHGLHLRLVQGRAFPTRVGVHHGKVEAERAGVHETGKLG